MRPQLYKLRVVNSGVHSLNLADLRLVPLPFRLGPVV